MENIFSIKDKVIIITGAGKGIGDFLAINMAKQSGIIYGIDLKFSKKVPKNLSNKFFQINCDITQKLKFQKICKMIFEKHKRIDALINNAGITLPNKKNVFYSEKKWDDTLKINLTSHFNCSQTIIKYMMKNKSGSIINITSLNAELGFPNNPAYVASKGGLKMLGKALARDWGKHGIRVNNLGPGYIKTDMTQKSFNKTKIRKEREKRIMLGKWGEVKDLLGPCIFLISNSSSYITGQDIYVDGGWISNGLSDERN